MTDCSHKTALLALDVQDGLADQPWAATAVDAVSAAVSTARTAGLLVVYSRVAFRPHYLDVAGWNRVFAPYARHDSMPPAASRLSDRLRPAADEPVIAKARFSPFIGTDLTMLLRAQQIGRIALTGLTTGGVVAAAHSHAENHDLAVTVLSDACADPDPRLHDTLLGMFARSATITTSKEWRP